MTMQSRRDLFQAHRLMTQRAALALLRGEPDVPDQPLRRINVATFIGILMAVIVVAGFGIWGLLFKGGGALTFQPDQATLIIDKQTGTNYVFCGKHHQNICPMTNHSSALLALQSPSVSVEAVNQSSLTSIPHGPELGIPGLPQDLPGPGLLITQPWSVCTQQLSNVVGAGTQTTVTLAGGIPTDSQPLGSQGLLVKVKDQDQVWIILNGQRLPIFGPTIQSLYSQAQVVTVPLAWLNSIPQSQATFQAPVIPDQGATVTSPTGAKVQVGQLYQESGTGNYFVTLQGGTLAPISQLQYQLLNSLPGASPRQPINSNALPGHVVGPLSQPGLPATKPAISGAVAPTPFCVVYSGSAPRLTMQVETGGRMPHGGTATGVQVNTPDAALVNNVVLPPGTGALVRETGDNISYFLVTGGRKYPLASKEVPSFLGYSTSQAVQLPASVMDLIPSGPGFKPFQANDAVSS
jgi:ESX secretion system ATPase EccB